MDIGMLLTVLSNFLGIYSLLLFIRILLSWFPNVDWMSQPFAALSQITDPYLNVFRSFIPPLGGIDFSPMLAIILLQFVQRALGSVAVQASLY
jgi:YggT family protein